jgi:WD40 repeat protein
MVRRHYVIAIALAAVTLVVSSAASATGLAGAAPPNPCGVGIDGLEYSADGHWILFGNATGGKSDGDLCLESPQFSYELVRAAGGGHYVLAHNSNGAAWSPRGARLAFTLSGPAPMFEAHLFVAAPPDAPREIPSVRVPEFRWAPDGRHIAFYPVSGSPTSTAIAAPDGSDLVTFPVRLFSWSPDGTRLTGSEDGRIIVAEVASGESHVVDTGGVVASLDDRVSWAPRGSLILFTASDGEKYVVSFDGATARRVGGCGVAGWAPDARSVSVVRYSCVYNGTPGGPPPTDVVDVASGRRLFRTYGYVTWSPTGRQLAISSSSGTVLTDRARRHRVRLGRSGVPVWAKNGLRLAISDGSSGGVLVFTNKGRRVRRFAGQAPAGNFRWSPSGKALAFICRRNGRRSLCVGNVATGRIRVLARGELPAPFGVS